MYSVHDRVIVDNMSEFEHSSSRASCNFSMQDSRVKRGKNIGHTTQQTRLPADSGLSSLVNPRDSLGSKSCSPMPHLASVSSQKFLLPCCSCFALCSCLAHCCHDPFIVRNASNLTAVPWFHSFCACVSMFTINVDNCLFLSLFLFLCRYLNTTKASVQTSRPLHLHRSKPPLVHTNSVYVRTMSADFAPDPSSACYHHLVVECGIQALFLRMVATFARFLSFLILT